MESHNPPLQSLGQPNAFDALSACIHCGMCLPACPTYRVTGSEAESPRGRLYLMRASVEGQLAEPKQLMDHLDLCLGCLGCQTACPSGVNYEALLMQSRQKLVQYQNPVKRWIRRLLLKQVLPRPFILNGFAKVLRLYQISGLQRLVRNLQLPKLLGPLGKQERFMPQIPEGKPISLGQVFGVNQRGRVALFTGCIMNAVYHRVHQATIAVLVANGYEVVIPEQTCCGALAHHSGERDIVESLAKQNLDKLLAANPDWIVVNAAGCGSTLKEYDHILEALPEGRVFSEKVIDVMALLAKRPLAEPLDPVSDRVTYHAACHLHHAQRVQQEPYEVLKQIPGLTLIPLTEAEMCCGSAGVYNLAHPDLSLAILQEKMGHVEKTQADIVLAANPGCMLQLETGIAQSSIAMDVMHPIEILAKAYRDQ